MSYRTSSDAPAAFREFAARLLGSMGLSAVVVAAGGCGANVVFDEPSGEGGAGGSSTHQGGAGASGGEGAGGTTVDFPCDVVPAPEQSAVYQCISMFEGTCLAASTPEVYSELAYILEGENCDDFCCDTQTLDYVACGPDPSVIDQCCYTAVVGYYSECMGRPFTVLGEARTASLASRDDWVTESARSSVELDETTRLALSDAFSSNGLMEHASVASFARFALDLLSLGAPASLVRAAQRAMGDEIRHAELCFSLASRYAGRAIGPKALDCHDPNPTQRTAEDILAATIREGCVGETIAALLAARAADQAEDPGVREALREIAEDEARHAELAWQTIAWALKQRHAAWRKAIERTFAEPFVVGPGAIAPAKVDPAAWRAHGQLDPASYQDVVARARTFVIGACARALLSESEPASREKCAMTAEQ
ncbi:MAG: ferritin-like domain-containing protein [Polyangiaceae bacterium]|nr:ferritin-like domain-containing protein [Polyangiaceae bacterium]